MYILMSINGNNEGDVAGVFLLENESTEAINLMIRYCKEENPCWCLTNVILTDKDISERNALMQQLPDVKLLLCLLSLSRHPNKIVQKLSTKNI